MCALLSDRFTRAGFKKNTSCGSPQGQGYGPDFFQIFNPSSTHLQPFNLSFSPILGSGQGEVPGRDRRGAPPRDPPPPSGGGAPRRPQGGRGAGRPAGAQRRGLPGPCRGPGTPAKRSEEATGAEL